LWAGKGTLGILVGLVLSWGWGTQAGSIAAGKSIFIIRVALCQALVDISAVATGGTVWGRRGGGGRLGSHTSDEGSREKDDAELHFEEVGLFDIKYVVVQGGLGC